MIYECSVVNSFSCPLNEKGITWNHRCSFIPSTNKVQGVHYDMSPVSQEQLYVAAENNRPSIFDTKHVLGWKPVHLSYRRCTCRLPRAGRQAAISAGSLAPGSRFTQKMPRGTSFSRGRQDVRWRQPRSEKGEKAHCQKVCICACETVTVRNSRGWSLMLSNGTSPRHQRKKGTGIGDVNGLFSPKWGGRAARGPSTPPGPLTCMYFYNWSAAYYPHKPYLVNSNVLYGPCERHKVPPGFYFHM